MKSSGPPQRWNAEVSLTTATLALRATMADDDPTSTHEPRKLTGKEITYLADRCMARGVSALFDAHYLQGGFLLISALLRQLVSDHPDGITVDVWRKGQV